MFRYDQFVVQTWHGENQCDFHITLVSFPCVSVNSELPHIPDTFFTITDYSQEPDYHIYQESHYNLILWVPFFFSCPRISALTHLPKTKDIHTQFMMVGCYAFFLSWWYSFGWTAQLTAPFSPCHGHRKPSTTLSRPRWLVPIISRHPNKVHHWDPSITKLLKSLVLSPNWYLNPLHLEVNFHRLSPQYNERYYFSFFLPWLEIIWGQNSSSDLFWLCYSHNSFFECLDF